MASNLTPLGWPVLEPDSDQLFTWHVPGWTGFLRLRQGAVGFILIFFLTFVHERVERLDEGHPADDWGHSKRKVTHGDDWSEHAAGSGADFNATQHPYGVATEKTFTSLQIRRIRRKLRWLWVLAGTQVIRWGGDYKSEPDGMHVEVVCKGRFGTAKRVARLLARTPRGMRVLKANPGQRELIFS